jgi:hypothetical protein
MYRACSSFWMTLSGILLQISSPEALTAVLREREIVETHTLPISRDRSALTAALKPFAFDGTTISFSALSWAVKTPGQDSRNQARKGRVSRTPEIKRSFLLGGSPVAKQAYVIRRVGSCAIRLVDQRSGHVARHTPIVYLSSDSYFRRF